jgi:hypothetical protein
MCTGYKIIVGACDFNLATIFQFDELVQAKLPAGALQGAHGDAIIIDNFNESEDSEKDFESGAKRSRGHKHNNKRPKRSSDNQSSHQEKDVDNDLLQTGHGNAAEQDHEEAADETLTRSLTPDPLAPDKTSKNATGKASENAPCEKALGKVAEQDHEEAADETLTRSLTPDPLAPDETSKNATGKASENAPGEKALGKVAEQDLEEAAEKAPGEASENAPGEASKKGYEEAAAKKVPVEAQHCSKKTRHDVKKPIRSSRRVSNVIM